MPSRKQEDLHLILGIAFSKALLKYEEMYPNAPKPFLTCTYRSGEEQDVLFNQGRTTNGKIITMAKKYESPHNYLPSFAFDIAFLADGNTLDWSAINFKNFADILTSIDTRIEWGGMFKTFVDRPHYQLKGWKAYIKN